MGFFGKRFSGKARSNRVGRVYFEGGKAGYGYRYNFGRTKLDNIEQERFDRLPELVGQDAMDALFLTPELTPEQLKADTSYMTIVETFFWCGDNLRMALLEYVDAEGRLASRFIEYYSFRRTLVGNIIVFGWSHREKPGGLRSYRLDRVITVQPTLLPYEPKWPVEIFQ